VSSRRCAVGVAVTSGVGHFIYDSTDTPFEVEDRTLAHLRLVIMTKMRRGESFMMKLSNADRGDRWLWLHPSIPVQMRFHGSREPALNMAWIDQLMKNASSSNGFVITPEPEPLTED